VYFFLSTILAPLINLTNLILLIYIISYFFKKFFFSNVFRIVNYAAIFFLILFSLLPIGKKLTNTIEKEYITSVLPAKYDYIVVLAGGEETYTTFITNKLNLNSASERLIASVRLANKKKDSKIIYLGGSGMLRNNNSNKNEANVAKLFFKDVNFDLKRVIFIDNTRNTIENLKEFKKLNLQNEHNPILITSAFHMKRSLLISEKLDLNLIPYAVDFRSFEDAGNDSLLNYYQRFSIVGNLQSINLYFREFLGIIAVKISM
jgi:uncharacterized SAM-binding protein YcdF (DUF218 family)